MSQLKENLVVIIPAYEPPQEFVDYAREVAGMAKSLVVVNDGSDERYDAIFDEIAKIENVHYLTYEANHGKGYALKHAFRFCIENFAPDTTLVTADCDGQHKVKDIVNVYKAAQDHPEALVLGSRDFTLPNVPKRSRAGNTQMRWQFKAFYGLSVYDTQTGLRGFSAELAKSFLNIKGDRFEFELGELIWASKAKIEIYETPIDTVYPENPTEHVSHFKTISDSLRVMGVMLTNLGYYLLSSVLSAVVDVLVFFLLSAVVFPEVTWYYTLAATVTARVTSSIINFTFNYKYVFGGAGRAALIRYYILWACQLCASYGIASFFSKVVMFAGVALTVAKGIGDLCLALLSYQIQQHWVFRGRDPKKFWGPLVTNLQSIVRPFSKKYRCNVLPYDEGAVYVCRHLDMHGPMTTLKWLPFHTHPMVFSPFFTESECYRQYADYTFTVRVGKPAGKFNMKAYLASRAVPKLVRSIRAVPVYRGTMGAYKTMRYAVDHLVKKQSVIVYPDIDYVGEGGESDIYDGFLYLGELYHRQTGKSLRFIPLYIDDERATITAYDAVYVDKFKEDAPRAKLYLKAAINGRPYDAEYVPESMYLGRSIPEDGGAKD